MWNGCFSTLLGHHRPANPFESWDQTNINNVVPLGRLTLPNGRFHRVFVFREAKISKATGMIDSENFSSLSSPTHKLQFSTKWMPRCRISRLFNPQQGECGRPGTKPSNISYYNLFRNDHQQQSVASRSGTLGWSTINQADHPYVNKSAFTAICPIAGASVCLLVSFMDGQLTPRLTFLAELPQVSSHYQRLGRTTRRG